MKDFKMPKKLIHIHLEDALASNSKLEVANRLIRSVRSNASDLSEITGERGSDGGSIDNARRALKRIMGAASEALNSIG